MRSDTARRPEHACAAAILAGGGGTRMGGCDKSALDLGGHPLLNRQLAVLRELTTEVLVVGEPDLGPANPRRALPPGVRAVADRLPGRGPLGGLYTALTACRAPQLLVVACDMPFLAAPFLRYLMDAGRDGDVALVRTADGYHPLCASYRVGCAEVIGRRLAAGQLKVTDMLEEVRVRAITPAEVAQFGPEQMLLFNINTPDDYARAGRLADHTRSRQPIASS